MRAVSVGKEDPLSSLIIKFYVTKIGKILVLTTLNIFREKFGAYRVSASSA